MRSFLCLALLLLACDGRRVVSPRPPGQPRDAGTTDTGSCTASCTNKECGDDGCGGSCGSCPLAAPFCVQNTCEVSCTPDCTNKECGDDGCGGSCGSCPQAAPNC